MLVERFRDELLTGSGLSGDDLVVLPWLPIEMVRGSNPTQPWLSFKGNWGQPTDYLGWSGPARPPIKSPSVSGSRPGP